MEDPNDLLSTNIYIPEPVLSGDISLVEEEDFRKYYKQELDKKNKKKIQDKINIIPEEEYDENLLHNNTNFNNNNNNNNKRLKKDIKTIISIDSRDRNKTIYPLASSFTIPLGKTYYNVREVKLISIEFPNTNAVINSKNNMIYWINEQDISLDTIDSITGTYKIYQAQLTTGSYTISTLENALTSVMNLVKRGDDITYHYFVINLDLDTDVVEFISLIVQNLPVNPFTTTVNTGIITVNAPSHGFVNNQTVYLIGTSLTGGISSSTLNGFQTVTVINNDIFQFEVNISATETVTGGGNTVQVGILAPFQFQWGQNSNTVAQNIGYPLENSSLLISTNISSISNYYQIQITTTNNLPFIESNNVIGTNIILQNTNGLLNNSGELNGLASITNILDTTNFLINVSASLAETIYVTQTENNFGTGSIVEGNATTSGTITNTNNNTINSIILQTILQETDNYYVGWWIVFTSGICINQTRLITEYSTSNNTIILNTNLTNIPVEGDIFKLYSAPTFIYNSNVYTINTIQNYKIPTVLIEFFTNHNYTYSNINSNITLYNTTSVPNFDGPNILLGIPSPTSIYIPGTVLSTGAVSTTIPGKIGSTPSYNILTTLTYNIQSITIGTITTIYTTSAHILSVGDIVSINGLSLSPLLTKDSYSVYSIPTSNSFTINVNSVNYDVNSLSTAYIGTDIVTLFFPKHGFNSIINVTNISNIVTITTLLQHNLSTGNLIRIMQTGISYIDNSSYTITVLTNDSFSITVTLPLGYICNSQKGILGMSNNFLLYDCSTIGGISSIYLNNVIFNVNEIIDENTFNFHVYNSYATSTMSGGYSIYISSFLHGFNGIQTNSQNDIINRAINLEGENYSFLCCPQLSTVLNTGSVSNIFARIILDQSPGCVSFNFLSNPKIFQEVPLEYLDSLDLSILNYDGTPYIFNDLDYSLTLEISEVLDTSDGFNISSKRGIADISSNF